MGIILLCICISKGLEAETNDGIFAYSLGGTVTLLLSMVGLYDFYKTPKIVVSQNNIILEKLLTGKKTEINFNEIESISIEKIQSNSDAGPISDGYYVNVIHFKNSRRSLIISPIVYNNYKELISEIRAGLNQHVV